MSILIKGMEMPTDIEPGLVIEFADGIDGKRYARLYHYRHGGLTKWLEAIPVPPHGRLGDLDALIEKVIAKYLEHERKGELVFAAAEIKQDICDLISDAPTIIEAEGGE